MKKLLLVLLLFPIQSFAVECHHQSNPMGYANYDICEVEGTGYSCVSLEGKANSGISCFPTPSVQDQEEYHEKNSVKHKGKYGERGIGE